MGKLYAPPTQNGLQKTLDAQLDQGVTASMTLNNTTGVQNLPGVVLINRIDTDGNELSPSVREFVIYQGTSGSTLTSLTRGVGGSSDQDHAVGSVVEFVPDITVFQGIYDALKLFVDPSDNTVRDIQGGQLDLDADNDTSITADTDDQMDYELGGSDRFRMKTSDFDMVTSTANVTINGSDPKRGIYIPASALTPATTNGCAALAQSETTTNKLNYKTLDFDASTEEYAWLLAFQAPDYWDLSTITVKFHWTAASSSGDVIWGAAAVALSNDDALDTALGTAQTVTDTLLATGDVHTTSATSAITVGGTPAKGDMLFLRVYRDADAGGDTLGADAKLIAITVKFAIGQYDDQ